jgi:hypothetical protein
MSEDTEGACPMFIRPILRWTFFGILAASSVPAAAQQHCSGPQIGTWKLQSYVTKDLKTGRKSELLGAHPGGFISYGPDCRVQVIMTRDGRKPPVSPVLLTDAEKIDLYDGFEAYAGTYSIKGDIVSHHIDASWNQAWTGTTQSRRFKIDANRLDIITLGGINPYTGKPSSSELIWTKVE